MSDITYSTAKEAGFDYLRDHLCYDKKDLVHRAFHFAIVDEADSVLIDEARVPLVIAGIMGESEADSCNLAEIVKCLQNGIDFITDEGKRNVYLTDAGLEKIEAILSCGNLHDPKNMNLLTRLNCALHAEALLKRDIDYIVRNGKVEIVDEFTGRVVIDRQWPDGLQAAVEAKEKLHLRSGGSILSSITIQHFLRLYPKICGMTATAQSAADEFYEFYDLKVVIIPPNKPCIRKDYPDVIFTHKQTKAKALIAEIKSCHSHGRPILVGTASVEESEEIASALEKSGVSCQVLNAKNDELEAKIVAQAGSLGAVTISTNMAGRGTDIKLGGHKEQEREKVVALGGLYVIGTNRHERLRIDNQLRGRAGRQGDPGSSRFFISLEDDLIQRYGIEKLIPSQIRSKKQDNPFAYPLVNREIKYGQRIIEGQNFEIRKTLWKYSSLIEKQRKIIQQRRQNVLLGKVSLNSIKTKAQERFEKLSFLFREKKLEEIERQITLFHIDRCWAEYLAFIADVRESIHLVNIAGETPLVEFKRIVTEAFLDLIRKIDEQIIEAFESVQVTENGIKLDTEDFKGPSSTWTYLIDDNQFGFWMGMLKGRNIGFAAWGALQFWPLFLVWWIYQRFFRGKRKK